MSSERTHCMECGKYAPYGETLCNICSEVAFLNEQLKECRATLKEFVGPDGRSWKITIKEQSHTIGSFARAREKVEALLAMGFWYLELTEVK